MLEVLFTKIYRLEKILQSIDKGIQEQLKHNFERERLEVLVQILLQLQHKKPVSKSPADKSLQEKWLDKQEVLQVLKISERTLFNLRKNHMLPYKIVGGKLFFHIKHVEALLENAPKQHPT